MITQSSGCIILIFSIAKLVYPDESPNLEEILCMCLLFVSMLSILL